MKDLSFDYETKSARDLKKDGLDRYARDPSTRIIMIAYSVDFGPVKQWVDGEGPMPREFLDALRDPNVTKRAWNAQFERVITKHVLKIDTGYANWRCTMALAYMLSFTGTLDEVGKQVDLPFDKQKLSEGKRLVKLFCSPQKLTKKQIYLWRDEFTDPLDWELFCEYNRQDVTAEISIYHRLKKYPILQIQWEMYELDQIINDRGLPVNVELCRNGVTLADRRKEELTAEMIDITGLANPNSIPQLGAWVRDRGYPFGDLGKDTVKKVLRGALSGDYEITSDCRKVLRLRQQVARTSVKKFNRFLELVSDDGFLRYQYQYAGASRTNRFSGRGVQPHNLPRTLKQIEPEKGDDIKLRITSEAIEAGDYDLLTMLVAEPMDALAGCVRSAISAPEDFNLVVADLASIESVVIGWLSKCEALLDVFRQGRDAYKDFAVDLYGVDYEDVTKEQRTNSKPAVLGCGYRLGPGGLDDEGKRTGLWGYAENMGVDMPLEDAKRAVKVFRDKYREIVDLWYDIEDAIQDCVQGGRPTAVGPVRFELMKPFLTAILPSGRRMYYYKPRIETKTYPSRDKDGNLRFDENGELMTYTKKVFTYEGRGEGGGKRWGRIDSHGGKVTENLVQAIAFDILCVGMLRAHKKKFYIVGSVHDEIKNLQAANDSVHTLPLLISCMTEEISWCADMPLGAAGWAGKYYRKD